MKDLTGNKIFRWNVIKRAEDRIDKRGKRIIMWECECECGTVRDVRHDNLIQGTSKSCGCLKREKSVELGKRNKKKNTYDLDGEYGIGYTHKGEEFWFDKEDYNLIKNYCWRKNKQGYILSRLSNSTKTIFLHDLVMNADYTNGEEVDHIKHIGHDNRKSQLRLVDKSKNQRNTGLRCDNKSGVKGVFYKKDKGLWVARITVNKKRIFLGSSKDFDKAVRLRKEAEEKYFGEYSYDNSINYVEKESA